MFDSRTWLQYYIFKNLFVYSTNKQNKSKMVYIMKIPGILFNFVKGLGFQTVL